MAVSVTARRRDVGRCRFNLKASRRHSLFNTFLICVLVANSVVMMCCVVLPVGITGIMAAARHRADVPMEPHRQSHTVPGNTSHDVPKSVFSIS